MAATSTSSNPPEIRKVSTYGTATYILDFDVCRLSFYLKCCIHGCDIEVSSIDPRLIDYNIAHQLPSDLQYSILRLAVFEFGLSRFLNRVIFIDDSHKLLRTDFSNAFFAIETATDAFPIHQQPNDRPCDDPILVHKAMLCTTQWINEIYVESVLSLQTSFLNVPTNALHLLNSRHCIHCKGLGGHCTCEAGCPSSVVTCCTPIHRGEICSGCASGHILGPRFHCITCSDCNLCEACYRGGEHDQMHTFETVSRPNMRPFFLGSQACSLTKQDHQICLQEDVPVAVAVPIEIAMPCEYDDRR